MSSDRFLKIERAPPCMVAFVVPRTLSGNKQELPIKKLLPSQPTEKAADKDAMAKPGCLDWYVAFAADTQALPEQS